MKLYIKIFNPNFPKLIKRFKLFLGSLLSVISKVLSTGRYWRPIYDIDLGDSYVVTGGYGRRVGPKRGGSGSSPANFLSSRRTKGYRAPTMSPSIIFSFLFQLLYLVVGLAPLGLYINAKQQHWCTNAYILNWYSYWSLYCQISPSWLWQADSVRNVKWLGDSLVQ